jgi:type IV pilus assembly protein PilV
MNILSRFFAERTATRPPPLRALACKPQRGIALLEALISILIFSFGVIGLIGLEARAINFSVDAEDRNRAAVFASEVANSMWLAGSVTVTTPAFTTLLAGVNDPTKTGLPNGTVTITPVTGTTNSADIVLTWKPPSRAATDDPSVLTTRVILP